MTEKKKITRKRARTAKGRFKADDPNTPLINEAYETIYTVKDFILAIIIGVVLISLFVLI